MKENIRDNREYQRLQRISELKKNIKNCREYQKLKRLLERIENFREIENIRDERKNQISEMIQNITDKSDYER